MKTRLAFLSVVVIWWTLAQHTALAAHECTSTGAIVQANFNTQNSGWYCSASPGASEHACMYDQQSDCTSACSSCGGTFTSSGDCPWERSQGSAPGDSTALYYGCTAGNWAQYYRMTCNCNYSCKEPGQSCSSGSECCSGICNGDTGLCGSSSPILINLANNSSNYHLTSAADGVFFDLDSNGSAEQLAWTEADADIAFLAMDRNANGAIDNGSELFGNFTPKSNGQRATNGFDALADLDASQGNGDGKIDAADAVYPQLHLWLDRDRSGTSDQTELVTLAAAGVATIFTDYSELPRTDRSGNQYKYRGTAMVLRNGHEVPRAIFDVFLATVR